MLIGRASIQAIELRISRVSQRRDAPENIRAVPCTPWRARHPPGLAMHLAGVDLADVMFAELCVRHATQTVPHHVWKIYSC